MKEEKQTILYSYDVKRVLWLILILNIIVLLIKIFAGIVTRSLAIFGDAAHSTSDMLNNIVGLVVLKYAVEPADRKHPYGHGKFETLAAFGIVIFLAIAGVELLQSAVQRLIHPVKLPLFKEEIVWLLLLTLVINLFVWLYERSRGKKFKSDLLVADSSHTGSDVLITLSVLASQFFIAKAIYWVDSAITILIVLFIAKAAYEILTRTVPILVDEAWIDPNCIKEAALSINDVTHCYDVYSRRSPHLAFIECKIKVVPRDLYSAHKVADKVEEKLKQDFGECTVTVHVEP